MNILKVMVVDDEFPIRKWFERTLKNLPDVKVDMIGTASNGEEALEMFREKRPDVVFTDIKMPVMDGLELLQIIKKEQPKTEVIIISSYDEFAYAKKAIALDAFDYVLKPETNSRMLSELLKKILTSRQESFLQKDALALRFEQEIFLNGLVSEKRLDCTGKELEEHGIYLNENGMFAIAVGTNSLLADRILEVFLNEGVENVLYYAYQKNVLIAMGNTACIEQMAYQNQVIFQFAEKLGCCFDSPVGISGPCFQYSQLVPMIQKSVLALSRAFYQKRVSRVFYSRDVVTLEDIHFELERREQELMGLAKAGEQEALLESAKELLDYLEGKAPGDVQAVKLFLFRMTANICQVLFRDFIRLTDAMGELYRKIECCDNFEKLRTVIQEQIENRGHEEKKVSYSPYVTRAMEYIEKNYSKIVYITDVANQVGLNDDYLGHLFKNETGMTVNQFLNNTRMNRAIWLLTNTQLKTYEIAEKVGYANSGYFSKLFKQKFHVSPYEFRNMQEEQ